MANIMLWVTMLLTLSASCFGSTSSPGNTSETTTAASSAPTTALVPLNHSMVTAACSDDESIVKLNLTGVYPRPTEVIINGDFSDSCTHDISNGMDNQTITVNLTLCGILQTQNTEYTLYIRRRSDYRFTDDLHLLITCTPVNFGMIDANASISEMVPGTKPAEYPITQNPSTEVTMIIESSPGVAATSVNLGADITLTITALANVSFEVTGCTVESTGVGPYNIINGWCSIDTTLLSNFANDNTAAMKSSSTIKAFRLAHQSPSDPLTFKCNLKWCPNLASFCKHPDTVNCQSTSRRRRAIDGIVGQYANEKTLTSSIHVNLPGYPTKSADSRAPVITNIDYIMKLMVLLFCGFRFIV